MLGVNSAIFFMCLFPFKIIYIEGLVIHYGGPEFFSYEVYKSVAWIGRILTLINSAINPIVYSITNPRYREAFLEAFGLTSTEGSDRNSIGTISSSVRNTENTKV